MGRLESPDVVAQRALEKLLEKIPEMKTNYAVAMDRFASDPEAQGRYVAGVASWTAIMRTPSVREAISRAVQEAKKRYRELVAKAKIPIKTPA